MKVAKLEAHALSVPLDYPFRGPDQMLRDRINPVIAKLTTDEGLDAFGLAFAWNDRQVKSLKTTIDDLEYRPRAALSS